MNEGKRAKYAASGPTGFLDFGFLDLNLLFLRFLGLGVGVGVGAVVGVRFARSSKGRWFGRRGEEYV